MKKKKGKKKDDSHYRNISNRYEQHEWHTTQLLNLWNKVQNDEIDHLLITHSFREDVEIYVQDAMHQSEWFDDDELYKAFDLDTLIDQDGNNTNNNNNNEDENNELDEDINTLPINDEPNEIDHEDINDDHHEININSISTNKNKDKDNKKK